MTSIVNTTEVVDHGRERYLTPDLVYDLTKIFKDTSSALDDVDFSTDEDDEHYFNKCKGAVESELAELKQLATGSDLENFLDYVGRLENLVDKLAFSLILSAREADNLSKEVLALDTTLTRTDISDKFLNLSWMNIEELGCGYSLYWTLQNRAWTNYQLDFVKAVLPAGTTVELLIHDSTPDDVHIGVENWIRIRDKTVAVQNGFDTITFNAVAGGVEIDTNIDGVKSKFKSKDFEDIFIDHLNPTPEEIQMYEMAYHAVYDISGWKARFGSKPE